MNYIIYLLLNYAQTSFMRMSVHIKYIKAYTNVIQLSLLLKLSKSVIETNYSCNYSTKELTAKKTGSKQA